MWKKRQSLPFLVVLYVMLVSASDNTFFIGDLDSALSSSDSSKASSPSESEPELRLINIFTPKLLRESSLESYGSIESDPFGGIDAHKKGNIQEDEEVSSKTSSPISPVLPDYAIRVCTLDEHCAANQDIFCFPEKRSPTSLRSSGSVRKSLNLHVSFGSNEIFLLKNDEEIVITEADRASLGTNNNAVDILNSFIYYLLLLFIFVEDYLFLAAREGNLKSFEKASQALQQLNQKVPNMHMFLKDPKQGKALLSLAVLGKNLEIFLKAMDFEGVTFADLNPCKLLHQSPSSDDLNQVHATSYPPKNKSLLDDYDEDNDGAVEGMCENIEETILGEVIEKNAIKILKYLLTKSGIKDEYPNEYRSALHYAVEMGRLECVELLLQFGGSIVNNYDSQHQTPLFKVFTDSPIHPDGLKIAQLLLDNGAKIDETDIKMRNILHYIAERGSLDTMGFIADNYLIKLSKARLEMFVNAQERITGNTPLHVAKDRDMFSYMVLVQTLDANPKILNAQKKTASQCFDEAHNTLSRSRTSSRDYHRYY